MADNLDDKSQRPLTTPTRTLLLPDGRELTWCAYGRELRPEAGCGLWFHGTPSCYREAELVHEDAQRDGITIISFDRCGVGTSDPNPRTSIASTAADAIALMDHLQLKQVAAFGCSGGGPYAAALAALYPDRVRSLVLMAPVGPTWGKHRQLLKGMEGADKLQFRAVSWNLGLVWGMHAALRLMANRYPETLLEHVPEGMAKADGELLATDPRVRNEFASCLQHTYRRGARGVARDVKVLRRDWKVDISKVQCRTTIWQGTDDKSVPPSHAEWYKEQIPGATLHLLEGEGHITVPVRHAQQILHSGFD